MKVKKPIFIVGVGRSGSTIFHRMFSEHPNVAWLSKGLSARFPDKPSVNRLLMRLIEYPIVGRYLKGRVSPGECYDFWEYHCKGFAYPCRDLLPEDVTEKTKVKIRYVMSEALTRKRNRLLLKITGWPRIGFLSEIFSYATFIHIVRDGRAVVNSMINVGWWWGWGGPQNWRWGELTPSQEEEWKKYNRSFIALAAIEWKILMDALENAKGFIESDDFLEVKYEELCSNPLNVFRHVIEFCNLEWSGKFEDSLTRYYLRNTNYKWQNELTVNQKKIVENVLVDYLKRYDYL
jgi:hypothetical protein